MKRLFLAIVLLFACTNLFSQSISIQNIDRSRYPIIKGEILPFDANGKRISNLSKDNWTVYENGVKCDLVEDIKCPQATQTEIPVSVVLTIDVSWSMSEINFEGKKRIDIAKNAAKALVNALGSRSECALTTFSTTAKSSTNFSKDRSYINNQIDGFKLFENTGFYSSFMDISNGAIEKFKNSSNTKKVLVFLTDGLDNQGFTKEQINSVIEEAKKNNITIYCLSIAQNSPESLKRISQETGGAWYENINSEEQAKNLYLNIIQYEQNQEPCTIVWRTEVQQSEPVENMRIKSNQNGIDLTLGKQTLYEISKYKKFGNSKYHNFGEIPEGQGAKIKVDITALGNVNVNKIRIVGNEDFKLKNTSTSKINLQNSEKLSLDVMYEPSSKNKAYGTIEIQLSDQTVYYVNLEGGGNQNSNIIHHDSDNNNSNNIFEQSLNVEDEDLINVLSNKLKIKYDYLMKNFAKKNYAKTSWCDDPWEQDNKESNHYMNECKSLSCFSKPRRLGKGGLGPDGDYYFELIYNHSPVKNLRKYDDALEFSYGLAAVREDSFFDLFKGDYGYINYIEEYVIEPQFEDAKQFSCGVAAVKKDGKWGYIDLNGKFYIEPLFHNASTFCHGYAVVTKEEYGKYYLLDLDGKQNELILNYDNTESSLTALNTRISKFSSSGFAVVTFLDVELSEGPKATIKDSTSYYIINRSGQLHMKNSDNKLLDYKYIEYDSDNDLFILQRSTNNYWYILDSKLEKVLDDGLHESYYGNKPIFSEGIALVNVGENYQYINNRGERIAVKDHIIKEGRPFIYGLARVLLEDGKWYTIDKTGKIIK